MNIPECFCGLQCTKPCPFLKQVMEEIKEEEEKYNGICE